MSRKEYWQKHVDAFQSGKPKPLTEFCRENGLAYQTMLYWLRKLSKGVDIKDNGCFLPIKVSGNASNKIKVTLGDLCIELEKGFDENLLKEVISALRGASC